MPYEISLEGADAHTVDVARHGLRADVILDGRAHPARLRHADDAHELTFQARTERMWIVVDGDTVHVHAAGRAWSLTVVDPVERARHGGVSDDVAIAPMPGTVITVAVEPGQAVVHGDRLVVIESMKMQSEIIATRDGVVDAVFLAVGETFDRGAPLVGLVPLPTEEDA